VCHVGHLPELSSEFTVRQKPSFDVHRLGGKVYDLTVLRDEMFARQMFNF